MLKEKAVKAYQVSCSMLHEIGKSRSRSFFVFTLLFLAGVALHSFLLGIPPLLPLLGFCVCAFFASVFWNRIELRALFLAFLFLFIGIARFSLVISSGDGGMSGFKDKNVILNGKVLKMTFGKKAVLEIEAQSVSEGGIVKPVRGRTLIFLPPVREYAAGDLVAVSCLLRENKDWPGSAARMLCTPDSVRYLGRGRIGFAEKIIYSVRLKFTESLRASFPEPQLSLAGGLLLGNGFGLSRKLFDSFVRTGTAHIVAVSGWNITMVANYALGAMVALGLSRRRALPILVLFIFFYAALTGSGASVVRAAIMGSLAGLAWSFGRGYSARNALFAAAGIMVFISPRILLFDAGFALSFAATSGLIIFSHKFNSLGKKDSDIHAFSWAKETLLQTAAAASFTVPLVLLMFGNLSLVSPLANILMLPAVPLGTAMSFLAVLCGMISPVLGGIAGYVAWLPLTYIIKTSEILASLPAASVNFGNIYERLIVLAAPILAVAVKIFFTKRKKKTKEWEIIEA